jgi:hypothetical protein
MLTVVNRLKASFSVNTGFIGLQPIGKIANPNRLPALGLFGNDGIGLGCALGIHYQLF